MIPGRGRFAFHIPPESRIHIAPESVFTISRNAYSHAPEYAVGSIRAEGGKSGVNRRAWHIFWVLNTVGCITAAYGSVELESPFTRWSWMVSLVPLLPGNLVAMVAIDSFWRWTVHIQTFYLFVPVTVAFNAILWLATAFLARRLVRKPK